jgi:dGTP triphosphohydrolase
LQETTQAKIKDVHLRQVVCDYIAGMTDRFALNEHRRQFELEDRI